jgi:C1A family cysteine protease
MGSITMLLVVLALFGVAAQATVVGTPLLQLAQNDPYAAFGQWLVLHNKEYVSNPLERSYRRTVFATNVQFIAKYNVQHNSHSLDLNEFADLTWEEFSRTKLGYDASKAAATDVLKAEQGSGVQGPRPGFSHAAVTPPPAVDWREKGVVTPVKNQGACGSCWAFSATGAVEGVNALKTGKLESLSEQELVDCDTVTGNAGCSGGLMDYAFEWIKKNGGIDTEADYGYYSGWGTGTWCNHRKEKVRTVVTIDAYEDVPKDDEDALKKAASQQPVAVAICANSALQFYRGGIVDSCCQDLNHGVLLVGYGTDDKTNTPYWLVKNSWGGGWGDSGYFKLKAHVAEKGGMCGIAQSASYPIKEHANPAVPMMCDPFGWQSCAAGASCSCRIPFFFNLFCVRHDCCPLANGVGCADNHHCCPSDLPMCDTQSGTCYSQDGSKSAPWTSKDPAEMVSGAAVRAAAIGGSADEADEGVQRALRRGVRKGGAEYQQQ